MKTSITRFEVISKKRGREMVLYSVTDIEIDIQDDGRTMKIFIDSELDPFFPVERKKT